MTRAPNSVFRRRALAAVTAAALGLAGCGVKGQPEPPPDADPAEVTEPYTHPPPPPDGERPERPFVLDGLLM